MRVPEYCMLATGSADIFLTYADDIYCMMGIHIHKHPGVYKCHIWQLYGLYTPLIISIYALYICFTVSQSIELYACYQIYDISGVYS